MRIRFGESVGGLLEICAWAWEICSWRGALVAVPCFQDVDLYFLWRDLSKDMIFTDMV